MKNSILVLTDFSLAGERAHAYAVVLAASLGAELHLVHIFHLLPVATDNELRLPAPATCGMPATRRCLQQVANMLPVPATADLLEGDWQVAIGHVIQRYQPLLLVAGLVSTSAPLDEWLSIRTIALAHETGYPLLLVPEYLLDEALQPPHCLALAAEDQLVKLPPADHATASLFNRLACTIVPVTVLPPGPATGGANSLRAVRQRGLSTRLPQTELPQVVDHKPASGVLQAAAELGADLIAIVGRVGHHFTGGTQVGCQQLTGLRTVSRLPCGQPPVQHVARPVATQVELGRAPTPTAADGLRAFFLAAPAACW